LVRLGFDESSKVREFRDRHYFYGFPYQIVAAEDKPSRKIYGTALYFVIAENAEMIPAPMQISFSMSSQSAGDLTP